MAEKNISGKYHFQKQKMVRRIISYLSIMGVLLFGLSNIYCLFQYYHFRNLESQARKLQSLLKSIDLLQDDREAVKRYQELSVHLPEIELRILQRKWLIALEMVHQIQLAKNNQILEKEVSQITDKLKDHLDVMREISNNLFAQKESLSAEIIWRAYNISGAVKLLTAFLVLENERNIEKVQGLLREAISDLKASINAVDILSGKVLAKNIPRWNLELLTAEQFVRRFEVSQMEEAARLDLSDNLAVLIPERGGYAPGEPLERKVEK